MMHLREERVAGSDRKALVVGLLLAALIACLIAAKPAHASTTFTVNLTGDGADADIDDSSCDANEVLLGFQCTLRAAIQEANDTSGADTINFDIPGSYVQTISPESALPSMNETVTIDGYTQPEASPNGKARGDDAVLKIQLSGNKSDSGLSALSISGPNSVIRGLVINRFERTAIEINSGAAGSKVEGNFIGTDPSGNIDLGNGEYGVRVAASNVTVGGTSPAARNLISGNDFYGIELSGSDNEVMGNYIGTNRSGTGGLGNFDSGIGVFSTSSVIGGTASGAANVIAFNGDDGMSGYYDTPKGNSFLSNSVFSNGDGDDDDLGIDLDDHGVTPNDPGDADAGYNDLQNFPVLSSARISGNGTTIRGRLDSTPNKTFTIQFFSNSSGGQGQKFVGQKNVTTGADGKVSFTFKPARKVRAGNLMTATATNPDGSTSEFSAPRKVRAS